jgi:hypothetical protein
MVDAMQPSSLRAGITTESSWIGAKLGSSFMRAAGII